MSTDAACERARRAIETRDFRGWAGLPPTCSTEELFPTLPARPRLPDETPVRPLGEEHRPAGFQVIALAGYYRPTVSFREGRVVLFDAMNPELAGGLPALEAALGPPVSKRDAWVGAVEVPDGEWSWPQRGLTLYLGAHFDRVLHVALYAPSTLDTYLATLRPHLRKRPLPLAPR